ncbi:SDR family oxidoreductase [Kocuria palustris]|uniref:SDR family oxidoreductase n=1 Tax=Kocuria palustris TaxID=71999 RepID=UPI0011A3D1D1|nr:NAD(P)H-binding protein [Kocuria palustris]
MRIAIAGATGTAGRATAQAAEDAGHEVVALSRASGVDLRTGQGLDDALTGIDAMIDTSNPLPEDPDAGLVETFAAATRHLAEARQRNGVARLVHLSIAGIHDAGLDDFEYYVAQRAREEALAAAEVPHTLIRSAQWMEFALNPNAVTESEQEARVEDWLIQPIAEAEVGSALVCAAAEDPADRTVAGPEQVRLPELTRALLEARGDGRQVVTVPASLPAFGDGTLLAPGEAELRGPTVAQWAAATA